MFKCTRKTDQRIKIIRANVSNADGLKILKPTEKIIHLSELEEYRKSLKELECDVVRFVYEEID